MSPAFPITVEPLPVGIVDGGDPQYIPEAAFWDMQGFNTERGYPRSEYGRQKLNSAQIVTGARVRSSLYWEKATESAFSIVVCGYHVWKEGTPASWTFDTPINKITTGVASATRVSTTVTPSAGAKISKSLKAGDQFYYNSDGFADRRTIGSVGTTTFVLAAAYGGDANSGAFSVVRPFTTSFADLIPAGGRVFLFTGFERPHWYGDDGAGHTIFRPAGLPVPDDPPLVAVAAGGALSAGLYMVAYAFEDAAGRESNAKWSGTFSALAGNKATYSGISEGPAWATKCRFYRTWADGDAAYCVAADRPGVKSASKQTTSGNSTFVIASSAGRLPVDVDINRYGTFRATGNKYRIVDEAADRVTFAGATAYTTEAATDWIDILGGFDLAQIRTSGYVDLVADADLDFAREAPDENDQPPTYLVFPKLINAGGVLMAYRLYSQCEAHFSGRSDLAAIPEGQATHGQGEFDYWPTHQNVGWLDGDEVMSFGTIGQRVFSLKKRSVWELYHEDASVKEWFWFPVQGAQGVGCRAYYTTVEHEGLLYWLGHEGQFVDVIRFDGNIAHGMLRRFDRSVGGARSRVTVDSMHTWTEATAQAFRGRILLSYCYGSGSGSTTNRRTLDIDIKRMSFKIHPWGCGKFAYPYLNTNPILLCGDPTDAGNVFRVFGTAADNGSSITRSLVSKLFYSPQKQRWSGLRLHIVNGNTLSAAPTLSYSVDGLSPEDPSKVWVTTVGGDAWPTSPDDRVILKTLQAGAESNHFCFKLASTDQKDWGLKGFGVETYPFDQKAVNKA